jgi:hypothetical protein
MTGNSCMGGHLYELPVTGSVQLRTFKQVMFKSGLMEKSTFVVDLFVPEGTPTRWGGRRSCSVTDVISCEAFN